MYVILMLIFSLDVNGILLCICDDVLYFIDCYIYNVVYTINNYNNTMVV